MKVAPVYAELARSGRVEQRLVHTGQHYDKEVNDVFFAELPLPEPHAMLQVGSGSHAEQTSRALLDLERLFVEWRPDLVVVPGDVNSTLAAALAAAKLNIPVCHLEAGLRSFDRTMPEEHNRRLTDHLSTMLMTHSEDANVNLANEGVSEDSIEFVGNTMIDTLLANIERARELAAWREFGLEQRDYVLVTLHRARLVDDPELIKKTVAALEQVAAEIPVLFPVHPRTRGAARGAERLGPQAGPARPAASVHAVPVAPVRRRGDRDRFRRHPGGVDGTRSAAASRSATTPSGRSQSRTGRTRFSASTPPPSP